MSIAQTLRGMLGPLVGGLGSQSEGEKRGYTPSPLRAMKEITEFERFSSLLPYTAFDSTNTLFVLDTGDRDPKGKRDALGFAIEVSPQTGCTPEMVEILKPVLSSAPIGSNLQISLYASPRVDEQLKLAALLRKGDPSDGTNPEEQRSTSIFRVMARRRYEFLMRGSKSRLVPHLPFLVRNFRIVLTLTMPCDPRDVRVIDELIACRQGIHATLKAANFTTSDWVPDDLINWVFELTNPHKLQRPSPPPFKAYDKGRLIRQQIVDPDTVCRPSDDGSSLQYGMPGADDEVHSRLYTVTTYPDEYPLWGMGNLIGDFYEAQLGYPCPFVITMGAHTLERASNKSVAQMKGARATTNATSPMARFMPEFQGKKRAWDIVNRSYAQGMGEVEMYHQVLLLGRPDEIQAAERAAQAIWSRRGFRLVSQQFVQVPGLLGSLPMGFTPSIHKFYKRLGLVSRKITANAVNLAPLLAEWKGTKTPALQLLGRRGQLMSLSLFDNKGGNYNCAVAASSGSGKSVTANELMSGHLGGGGKGFIIDVGRAYEKTCRLLGGEFIEFIDRDDFQICINPFDRIHDIDEDMEILKPLVAQMISPSGDLDDEDRAVIEMAIRSAWDQLGPKMTVSDVAHELEQMNDPVSKRLGRQLFPFTRNGMYGKYFDGPSNVDFQKDLVVLELEELKAKKDLQSVVLFIMMFRITQAMYLDPDRSRRKLCIIDEAWDLMGGGNSGKFIEEGYRRARRYGGSFVTVTQSIQDYYKNPASQAALENSDWLILLKQKKESVEQLARSGRLAVDEPLKRVLNSVKTEEGYYSELYIHSPAGQGVGRLCVDPFSLLLYSSQPDDYTAIQYYRDQGMDIADAVDAVLRDRAPVREEAEQ